ncbi:MAG: RagB/SusD family nutrient uptake outer membrane protein [Tannerellaceae bacterium]|nr:RagB/SusD family nutrient uptake outer membrane protein [Tannerellaceae bacterium]
MKLKYIALLISLEGIFYSCSVTDISPIDSLTDASYWNSVSDLELYANNLYEASFQGPSATLDNISDNFVTTSYQQYLFNEFQVPSMAGSGDREWYWTYIQRCNFFLNRYQTVEGSEEEINIYVGEVRFFRAHEYFKKIKTFGDVPWYDKDLQTTDTELLYKARDPRDYVLGKIIEDLEFAIDWLPDYGNQVEGRLTKDAARTFLARVYLHEGTHRKYHNTQDVYSSEELLRKAVETAETIINTGYYEIVKGSDTGAGQESFEGYPLYYCNQFVQLDLTSNKECILPRIYEEGILYHELGRQASESGTGLSKDFVESFLCKDGSPISVSDLYNEDDSDVTWENELQNRDPRIYQIIDNSHRPYRVINGEQQTNSYTDVNANASVTGYPCVKFRSPLQAQAEARNSTYDWFLFRYAEVLLIYAEAKAELGECTQADLDKSINLLRDRVEMPHLTTDPVVDLAPVDYGYVISPLLYEIRRERRIELVQEGFRFDDIIRWKAGKLLENPKTMFGIRITDEVETIYPDNTFGGESGRPVVEYNGKVYLYQYEGSKSLNDAGRKWDTNDKRYLYPIPTDQLVLNPNLIQNPGWE